MRGKPLVFFVLKQQKNTKNVRKLALKTSFRTNCGGDGEIRTPVSCRSNGFQDRPVVTTSVTLRVCSLPNGRKRRYKIVLEFLLEMPGTGSHRHCKTPVFVRLCGHGRSEWNNGFQDRPVMTASVTLQIKLGKVYPLPEQGINWRRRRDLNPRALYTRLLP